MYPPASFGFTTKSYKCLAPDLCDGKRQSVRSKLLLMHHLIAELQFAAIGTDTSGREYHLTLLGFHEEGYLNEKPYALGPEYILSAAKGGGVSSGESSA